MFRLVHMREDEGDRMSGWQAAEGFGQEEGGCAFTRAAGCSLGVPQGCEMCECACVEKVGPPSGSLSEQAPLVRAATPEVAGE